MSEKTLAEEIITIIQKESTNTPPPETATVLKIHPDNLITITTSKGLLMEYVPLIGTAQPNDTVALLYLNDNYTALAIGVNTTHNHAWKSVATGDSPEKYTLYVNPELRLAELILVYKPATDKTGTTQLSIDVSDYPPLGISVRRSNKTGIDIGVATTGNVYVYGTVAANTYVQGALMWHY